MNIEESEEGEAEQNYGKIEMALRWSANVSVHEMSLKKIKTNELGTPKKRRTKSESRMTNFNFKSNNDYCLNKRLPNQDRR